MGPLTTLWGEPTALASLGALVAGVRISVGKRDKPALSRVVDLVAAIVMGAGVADYATPDTAPRVALAVGLIAGSVCDTLLDAFRALSPGAATSITEGVLSKFGYAKKSEKEHDDGKNEQSDG